MYIAKAISKFDPEVVKATEAKFMNDMSAGAPLNWYPNYWLCFLFLGRPAPEDKRCLVASESKTDTTVDALQQLMTVSNKTNRRSIAELACPRKKNKSDVIDLVDCSPDSTSDSSVGTLGLNSLHCTPPVRRQEIGYNSSSSMSDRTPHKPPKQVEVILNKDKFSSVVYSNSYLLKNYTDTLDTLYIQKQRTPDDVELNNQIEFIEKKKIKLLMKEAELAEKHLGYTDMTNI